MHVIKDKSRVYKTGLVSNNASTASLWSCDLCQKAGEYNLDSFSHVLWCPELAQLRKDRDINDDQHLVNYVRDAMRIREEASSN